MVGEFTLEIESLAFGGAGVGRRDGKVVFVPGAYPGDTIMAAEVRDRKSFIEARMIGLLSPSPARREAVCAHVDDCGGCPWMRLAYAEQLDWKRRIIAEQFSHMAKTEVDVRAVIPSPEEYGYRARVRLKADAAGGFRMGYCRPKSHDIVEIGRCAVANEGINAMIPELRRYISGNARYAAFIDTMKLETGHPARGGRVTIDATGVLPSAWLSELLKSCPSVNGVAAVFGKDIRVFGAAHLELGLSGGLSLQYGPGVFSQINPRANLALLEKVRAMSRLSAGEKGLDLFCGIGNITFSLAREGAAMTGVEFSPLSADDAEKNKKRLGMESVFFIRGDAGKTARQMAKEGKKFATVVLDPPRGGAVGMAKALGALAEERIVYISCYPPALARDTVEIRKEGFRLAAVEPVDMFPQTAHVETVALFERVR